MTQNGVVVSQMPLIEAMDSYAGVTTFSEITLGYYMLSRIMDSYRRTQWGQGSCIRHVANPGRQVECGNAPICSVYALLWNTVLRRLVLEFVIKADPVACGYYF